MFKDGGQDDFSRSQKDRQIDQDFVFKAQALRACAFLFCLGFLSLMWRRFKFYSVFF